MPIFAKRSKTNIVNVSLPDALQSFVDQQVAERGFETGSEYIQALIQREQDRQPLRDLVMEGGIHHRRGSLMQSVSSSSVNAFAKIIGSEGQAGCSQASGDTRYPTRRQILSINRVGGACAEVH